MKPAPAELFCPRCGKRLSERLNGEFLFRCPRCKSQVGGETRPLQSGQLFVVSVITAGPEGEQKPTEHHT
jgi:DNA-directed RNA polymerase subunit RPC12/RpoP